MRDPDLYPSAKQAVAQVLSTSKQLLGIDELIHEIHQTNLDASWTRSEIDLALNHLFQAIPMPSGSYGWLSNLLIGNTFRHPLSKEEIKRGVLLLDELEHTLFFPSFFESHYTARRTLQIDFFGEKIIDAEVGVDRKMWSLSMGEEFTEWIRQSGGGVRDDILITVQDAAAGHYTLRLQPHEMRDAEVQQDKNIHLAMAAEEVVMDNKDFKEPIPTWDLAAHLIARGFYKDSMPADDLHQALHYYSLLQFDQDKGYSLKAPPSIYRAEDEFEFRKRNLAPPESYRKDDFANGDPFQIEVPSRDFPSESDWEDFFREEADITDFKETLGSLEWSENADFELCENYAAYLDCFNEAEEFGEPLPHDDFHLLEAELAMLISLEMEFSYLLPDQQTRKQELAEVLYIDPDSLRDDFNFPGSDFSDPGFFDNDDIPF